MSNDQRHHRDELDRQLTRALRHVRIDQDRELRIGHPVPGPLPDEPSDDELLLLVDGKLDPFERRALEHKLEQHPYSADRVTVLSEALEQLKEPESERARLVPDMERASRLVFGIAQGAMRWLRGTDQPVTLAPLALATRDGSLQHQRAKQKGSEDFFRFRRRFGAWDALIQIENVPSRGIDVQVELSRDGTTLDGGRAELRRGTKPGGKPGKLVESVRVRDGAASFSDLPTGRYQLTLTQGEETIGQLTLEILAAS